MDKTLIENPNNLQPLAAMLTASTLLYGGLILPASAQVAANCTYQGISLQGEVSVVNSDPDIRVEVVASGADLRVQWVSHHAGQCGEWRKVGLGADFRIQIVPSGGDIKIQEVAGNPGL